MVAKDTGHFDKLYDHLAEGWLLRINCYIN